MEEYEPLSNRERTTVFLPLLLALALAGGTWLGLALGSNEPEAYTVITEDGNKYRPKTGKIEEILRFIDARYLEDENRDELEEAAIKAVLSDLDPHSSYISLDEIQSVNESLNGNFNGIGIEFYILEDTIYVVGVIEGGPSDSAGLQRGDKIIAINDTTVAGTSIFNSEVIDQLKGSAGSQVSLTIKSPGQAALRKVTITRGQIPMRSITAAYLLNDKTGLIKINRFSSTTYEEFYGAVDQLTQKGMEHLVLDLRRNPGGYLQAATDLLDQLFTSKRLLVYTEGRSYRRKEYRSTGKSNFDLNKVVVLIDEGSASASEIVAGAIQDNDRGLVIGRRSFGKGLVQEQYRLSDGSALRLTVARYFTPSGRYIQKPYEGEEDEYADDLRQRFESGELYSRDSIRMNDSTQYRTVNGRIVYGGGGIVPDIFIPLDTNRINNYFQQMSAYAREYVYKYLDSERASLLRQYPNYAAFAKGFRVPESLVKGVVAYAKQKDLIGDQKQWRTYQPTLNRELRAHIADQLYGDVAYYETIFTEDEMVNRAIKEIDREGSSVTQPSAMREPTE